MIGKLKRSLKERCPECGKILQIRVMTRQIMEHGVVLDTEEEYIACSNKNCDYRKEIEQKRRRRTEDLLI